MAVPGSGAWALGAHGVLIRESGMAKIKGEDDPIGVCWYGPVGNGPPIFTAHVETTYGSCIGAYGPGTGYYCFWDPPDDDGNLQFNRPKF